MNIKRILKFIKKIVISAFILYAYNIIVEPIELIIPINLVTVMLITLFGLPALFLLMIILVLIY